MTRDELVSALQSQTGLPHDKAARIVDGNLGVPTTAPSGVPVVSDSCTVANSGTVASAVTKRPAIGEKSEQLLIKRSAIARGAFVYEFSQARATNQTPGIPDLYLVWPTFALWWEVKTPTGVLSQPQARFMAQCLANGTPHGVGTHADFLDYCHSHGVSV